MATRGAVVVVAGLIGVLALRQTIRAAHGLELGRVSLLLLPRKTYGSWAPTVLSDVPALPVFISSLPLAAVLVTWTVSLLIRPGRPLWFVVWLPLGAVAVERGIVIALLAGEPDLAPGAVTRGFLHAFAGLLFTGVFSLLAAAGRPRAAQERQQRRQRRPRAGAAGASA
ncbi:hypothetical protein [Microbacterium jiangjiandongii]|uniref:hypothetical protein n=1 Tax=Microbacterium jiangjiandongii TaxID=3049071 RepID=UPI00214CE955|nr:hypothetical protein [Microbacterium sp. zg.Y843]MCR2814355.1 hypothetical protein [Microbacterium sp. zg.Y843]